MKLGIITDIHGNSPALQAVLDDMEQRNVDYVVCLGDIVGIGPDSNEVIEMLASHSNIEFVMGNHDLAVISAFRHLEPPEGHHQERVHHEWLANRITPGNIDFLSRMPMQLERNFYGQSFLFTHYHLNPDHYFLPIDTKPTTAKLEQIYAGAQYQTVCFGHHHIVHHFNTTDQIYFNPGALGCYDKPLARYGIVHITEDSLDCQLLEVPYDNTDFLRSYEKLEVPGREVILKIFHGNQIGF